MKRKMITKLFCAALTVCTLTMPAAAAEPVQDGLQEIEAWKAEYDGSGEDDPGIVPYFNTEGHVDRQCAYVAAKLNLTAGQKAVLVAAAKDADDKYKKVRGFHARKNADGASNYLANLKALEICGVKIGNVSNLEEYVLSRLPGISAQDKNDVRQMIQAILKYCEDEKNYTTREEMRYCVAGFGLHLIGDMFAHRTIIKKACLTNWGKPNTTTNTYFQTDDFIPATLEQFKSEVRQGKLCIVDMKPFMKTERWKNYIDKITFMPNRIRAAEQAAASFVETVFIKGIGFPDINYYLTEYNLQLENFAQYQSVL